MHLPHLIATFIGADIEGDVCSLFKQLDDNDRQKFPIAIKEVTQDLVAIPGQAANPALEPSSIAWLVPCFGYGQGLLVWLGFANICFEKVQATRPTLMSANIMSAVCIKVEI